MFQRISDCLISDEKGFQTGDDRLRMRVNVVDLGQLDAFVIAISVRLAAIAFRLFG